MKRMVLVVGASGQADHRLRFQGLALSDVHVPLE